MAKRFPDIGHNGGPDNAALRAARNLEAVAERTIERAHGTINQPRQENTSRRARMAAGVVGNAETDLAHAKTARKIADALRSGEAGALSHVKSLAEIRELDTLARRAMYAVDRAKNRKYEPGRIPTSEDVAQGAKAVISRPNVYLSASDIPNMRTALKGKGAFASDLKLIEQAATSGKGLSSDRHVAALDRVAKAIKSVKNADGLPHRHTLKNLQSTANSHIASIREYNRQKRVVGTNAAATLEAYLGVKAGKRAESPTKALERSLIGTKIPGFFQTPESLADRMAKMADLKPGMTVLEPSAGAGRLADAIKRAAPGVTVSAIEPNFTLQNILKQKGHAVLADDFTKLGSDQKFDRVVMNPPFEKGQDAQHVRKAFDSLKPGGKLVAIMGEGPFFRQDKASSDFRSWLDRSGGLSEKLPENTFKESGTGVNTRLVTLTKPLAMAETITAQPKAPPMADKYGAERQAAQRAAATQAARQSANKSLERKARAVGMDLARAERAHQGTSFAPEKRAAGAVGEVRGMIANAARDLRKIAKSSEQKAVLKSEISRYKSTLANKYNAVLDAKSRTMSSMITGPSNFPTGRNQKRLDTEMKRTNEMLDWDKNARKSMRNAVVGSASPEMKNAAEWGKLQREINRSMATVVGIDQKAEGFRGYTRSAFTSSIQGKLQRLAASGETDLVNKSLQHIKDTQASLKKPIFTDRNSVWSLGTAAEQSTIAKSAQAATAKANPEVRASVQFKGVDIVENRVADRLQLRFPGKPDASVRSELKSRGFRWSPKEGAWQRKLTDNARTSAVSALDNAGFGRAEAAAPVTPPTSDKYGAERQAAQRAAERQKTAPPRKSEKAPTQASLKKGGGQNLRVAAASNDINKALRGKGGKAAIDAARKQGMSVQLPEGAKSVKAKHAATAAAAYRGRADRLAAAGSEKGAAKARSRAELLQGMAEAKGKGPAGWSDEARAAAAKARGKAASKTTAKPASGAEWKPTATAMVKAGDTKSFAANIRAEGVARRAREAKANGAGTIIIKDPKKFEAMAAAAQKADAANTAAAKPAAKPVAQPKPKLTDVEKLRAKHARKAVTNVTAGMSNEILSRQERWAKAKLAEGGNKTSFDMKEYEKATKSRAFTREDINTKQFAEGKKIKLPNGQVINSTWYTPPARSAGKAMEDLATREEKYSKWLKMGKPKNFFSAGLTVGAPLAAALMAYDSTRSSAMASGNGKTANVDALKAAAVAGGTTAGVGVAIGAAIRYGMKASATVAKVGARAIPFALPAMAAYGAVEGYRRDGFRGAALGAIDVPTFGLASYAASKMAASPRAKAETAFRAQRDMASQAANGSTSDGMVAAHTRRVGTQVIRVDSRRMTTAELTRKR